jgi:glycosyltransferase involved in cell wall biosynthesis
MDISVVILTLNEELHIRRCIDNVMPWARDVFVVDCFSSDKTVEIAKSLGAQVFQNPWEGLYARQFNWALDHLPIKTKWVLRLDADEYLYPELIDEIKAKLASLPEDVTGVAFKRRHIFLGRWMKRGTYPVTLIRLFRYGKARCEQRLMDEHIELLEGRSVTFDGDFADHNLNDIGWWTAKHNGYALREAVDLLDLEFGILEGSNAADAAGSRVQTACGLVQTRLKPLVQEGSNAAGKQTLELQNSRTLELPSRLEGQAAEKRAKKMRYARMPLFWRALVYFCYRYVLRGGFLEGREGFLWHFLQGWWYRTLVDAKIFEIKRESGGDPQKMLALLRGKYGMKI